MGFKDQILNKPQRTMRNAVTNRILREITCKSFGLFKCRSWVSICLNIQERLYKRGRHFFFASVYIYSFIQKSERPFISFNLVYTGSFHNFLTYMYSGISLYCTLFITAKFFTTSVLFAHMYQFSLKLNSLQQKFSLMSNYFWTNTVVDCTMLNWKYPAIKTV